MDRDLGSPPRGPSRYKSARRKQRSLDETTEPVPSPQGDEEGLVRSKSRYHRKTETVRPYSEEARADMPARYHSKHRTSPLRPLYQEQIIASPGYQHRKSSSNAKWIAENRATPPAELGAQEPRGFATDEDVLEQTDSQRRLHPTDSGPPMHDELLSTSSPPQDWPLHSTPSGELFPPPRPVEPKKVDGPPQSSNIRATRSMADLSRYGQDVGCFSGLFRRKKDEDVPPLPGQTPNARPKAAKEERHIKPGGGGIVPGIDAPKSAINSGDRQVVVEFGKSKSIFPVTPTTTSVDLIRSAATCMSGKIDAKSALLVETFSTVGVQRALRQYEPIRDVMNSWDNDRQNSLLLVDPGTGTIEPELTLAGVPKQEPQEQTWLMQYSQKPGKWEKRFITLRSGGQMVQSKDADAQSKDTLNVCHLSDFDIYTPTKDKMKKKFKPPKAHCYAIKSQQKTSLFESTQDYVHLFSTSDTAAAHSFENAIQSWRSWYLVNVRGEGKKEKPKATPVTTDRASGSEQAKGHQYKGSIDSHYQLGSFKPLMETDTLAKPSSSPAYGRPASSESFLKSSNQFDVNLSPERRTSTTKRKNPPIALNSKVLLSEDEPLGNLARHGSLNKRSSMDQKRPDTSEFKNAGLLGRNYSQRRKDNEAREASQQQPFGGTSGEGVRRQHSTRKPTTSSGELKRSGSTRESGSRTGGHARGGSFDLARSGSKREKPKPLVDLTPQYKEPPQHSKKGKGYNPVTIGAGGLIESATSPEDPLNIPSHTVFRNTASGGHGGNNGPGLVDLTPQHREPVHHARKGKGYHAEAGASGLVEHATAPEDPLGLPQNTVFRSLNAMPEGRRRAGSFSEQNRPPQRQASHRKQPEAFTGGGLLASEANRQGWGTNSRGRGVIDGSHAGGKPLVDLNADSKFVQGSLLNSVERAEGGPVPAPVIDRDKRAEVNMKYGEGF